MKTVKTTCSGCGEDVRLTINSDYMGSALVKGEHAEIYYSGSDMDCETYSLPMWDCPVCDYADSYDHNYA